MTDLDLSARADNRDHCIRTFTFTEAEFRDGTGDELIFEGVASVVDAPYTVRDQWGEFEETIRSGSFKKTLRDGKADVALYVNHDYKALPLATRLDGSLTLTADPHLRPIARLNPLRPSVQEAYHAVKDGQARQMSIGFSVPKSRDKWNEDYTQREISEVNLHEVSIVWKGANHMTTGAFRSLTELVEMFPEGGDYDPVEVQRAIAHLQGLIPPPEIPAHVLEQNEMLRQMWDRRKSA